MKKRNVLFIPFVLSMVVGLYSCNIGSGGNTTTFPLGPAVVGYDIDMGGTYIKTSYGSCATPTLPSQYAEGDYLILSFTIDYDKQPSTKYATATDINVTEQLTPFLFLSGQYNPSNVGEYKLPISAMGIIDVIDGKVFLAISAKDKGPNYRLIYNSEEPDSAGIKNLYLQAQQLSAATSDVETHQVCDINSFIQQYGRDTTVVSSGVTSNLKYVKTNLKYLTGMSDETPVYKSLNATSSPISLFINR
jgi:hypothetical protein